MKQKLKELSKYCTEPKSEAEFLAIKLAAEKGGVDWYEDNEYGDEYPIIVLDKGDCELIDYLDASGYKQISVYEYCELLMKDESEFDMREVLTVSNNWNYSCDCKSFKSDEGYSWYANGQKVGNEVSLVKD